MNLPRKTTQQMYEVLHKDVMTTPEASFVMHELRCLIEDNENWKEKLRLLHFYCDWSVHSQIDRQWHCTGRKMKGAALKMCV